MVIRKDDGTGTKEPTEGQGWSRLSRRRRGREGRKPIEGRWCVLFAIGIAWNIKFRGCVCSSKVGKRREIRERNISEKGRSESRRRKLPSD